MVGYLTVEILKWLMRHIVRLLLDSLAVGVKMEFEKTLCACKIIRNMSLIFKLNAAFFRNDRITSGHNKLRSMFEITLPFCKKKKKCF